MRAILFTLMLFCGLGLKAQTITNTESSTVTYDSLTKRYTVIDSFLEVHVYQYDSIEYFIILQEDSIRAEKKIKQYNQLLGKATEELTKVKEKQEGKKNLPR